MPGIWPALTADYTEWAPPTALRGAVACLWAQVSPETTTRSVLVLPDACSDLIWEQGKGAYIAGPDTGPVPVTMAGATVIVAVRFRPAAGGAVLGIPLSELTDQRVDLADLLPTAASKLPADLPPAEAASQLLHIAGTMVADTELDPAVTQATRLLNDPRAAAGHVAEATGVSPRQLRRRFHASAGYGPKTMHRVLRFRRVVSRIDAGDPIDLATLAADAGYADQSHLTRECVQLSGLTPLALARVRSAG
jgi:AraC-like DNA-binding protein